MQDQYFNQNTKPTGYVEGPQSIIKDVFVSGHSQPAYAQLVSNTIAGASDVKTIAATTNSVNLLQANFNRKEALIANDSTSDMFIKFGTSATTTSYTLKLKQDDVAIVDTYSGVLDGVWASATGNCLVTELT